MIKGLLSDLREGGVISLQYANDTIIFSDIEGKYLRTLKCCLILFKSLSGMKINFDKSELVPLNMSDEEVHRASHIFGCTKG